MKKEYEIMYGNDFGKENHKMVIELNEENEKIELVHLICTIKVILHHDVIAFDVSKLGNDGKGKCLTIYFEDEKIYIENQYGNLNDWNFNINNIIA